MTIQNSSDLTPRQNAVLAQLITAYNLAGRSIGERVLVVAAMNIADQLKCDDSMLQQVFDRARTVADIPTLRVLVNAEREILVGNDGNLAIDYEGRADAMKRIHRQTALKLYAIKTGQYAKWVDAMTTLHRADRQPNFTDNTDLQIFLAKLREGCARVYDFCTAENPYLVKALR